MKQAPNGPEGHRFQIEGAPAVGRILAVDGNPDSWASPAGFEAAAARTDRGVSRMDRDIKPGATSAMQIPNPAISGAAGDSQRNPASSRAVMLAHLSADMGAALAAGDMEAARVAHDAIGRLLGAPGAPAAVVDLAAERERRAGG